MTIKMKINSNNGIAVQSVNSHYWVADGVEEAVRLVWLGDILAWTRGKGRDFV